jgi:hypothetical protein
VTVETFCAPLHEHRPPAVGTYGDEVADLADAAGMTLFPEQRMALDVMYAHDARGRLVATEFGCSAPRRNVKSHIGKAAALADLVLFGEPDCLWTAQLKATTDDVFANDKGNGLAQIFESYDFLRRMVAEVADNNNEQAIRLKRPGAGKPQPALKFMARSERGGRGLSGRKVTFDEALFLKAPMLSAMIPVLAAESIDGGVQVRYLGSPGRLQSAAWRAIRDRGRAGNETRLAWLEWAAPREPCDLGRDCTHVPGSPGCALDRPHLIRAANLAVDRLIDIDFVLGTERLALTAEDFGGERMGWWQDPPAEGTGDLDLARWRELADPGSLPRRPLVFGVDIGEDRTASIGAVWRRPDGIQAMIGVDQQDRVDVGLTPDQVKPRLVELCKRWSGRVALGGPSAALEDELRRAGVQVEVITAADFASACGAFEDRLRAGTIRHDGNQPELDASVGSAKWRQVGTAGERAWQLKDAPGIGPLAAVTRALASLMARPERVLEPVAIPATAESTGVAAMTF